jgi:hypothetical protein
MIYQIITPDQNSTIHTLNDSIRVISLDGAGVPNVVRREQQFASAHGSLDYGFRLQAREMTLMLFYHAEGEAQASFSHSTIR